MRSRTRTLGRLKGPASSAPSTPLPQLEAEESRREITIFEGVDDIVADAVSATLSPSTDESGMASTDIARGTAATSAAGTS